MCQKKGSAITRRNNAAIKHSSAVLRMPMQKLFDYSFQNKKKQKEKLQIEGIKNKMKQNLVITKQMPCE